MDEKLESGYVIIRRGALRRLLNAIGVTSGTNSSGQIKRVDADEPEPLRDTHNRLADGPIVTQTLNWIE